MNKTVSIVGIIATSFALLAIVTACNKAPKVGARTAPYSACPCAATASGTGASSGGMITSSERATTSPSQGDQVEEDDERVPVQLAVFGIAVTVAIIGVLGYLLRRALGLDRLPPPEEDTPHQ